jgi:hypothetical protein
LFKSGSKEDPTNYHGITIGSCLGKVFTKNLNSRLEICCLKRKIICAEQIGFAKGKRKCLEMSYR